MGRFKLAIRPGIMENFWPARMPESLITDQSDMYDDIKDNDKFKERELKGSSSPFPLLSPIILMDQAYVPVKFLI